MTAISKDEAASRVRPGHNRLYLSQGDFLGLGMTRETS
jgi:hypothetical protein